MSGARPDLGSLLPGVIFVALGLCFGVAELGLWSPDLRVVAPLVLVGAGLTVVAMALRERAPRQT